MLSPKVVLTWQSYNSRLYIALWCYFDNKEVTFNWLLLFFCFDPSEIVLCASHTDSFAWIFFIQENTHLMFNIDHFCYQNCIYYNWNLFNIKIYHLDSGTCTRQRKFVYLMITQLILMLCTIGYILKKIYLNKASLPDNETSSTCLIKTFNFAFHLLSILWPHGIQII